MCFDSLIEDEVHEKTIREMIRGELPSAFKDGIVAALVVLAVLATSGTPAWLIAASTLGAVVLGVFLHQFVLLAGISLLRWHGRSTETPHTA